MHMRFGLALAAGLVVAAPALAAGPAKVSIGHQQKVFPESVTSTADGTLYAGSIGLGIVFRAPPGADEATPFTKPQDGPNAILGVFADEAAGTLWVCYSGFGKKSVPAMLRAVDLKTGAVKAGYSFPDGSFCNDIATLKDGTAFATDTSGGRIMRLKPGADALETWFTDDRLKGVDGLSFGPDGALYLNNVKTNKLYRLALAADGSPGTLTELKLSQPIKGPDGMRFGPNGTLYLAENGAGQVDAVKIDGDTAEITPIKSGYEMPTAVTVTGDTLHVLEAKLSLMRKAGDPWPFYIYAVPLSGS